jgi:hypothetical protein
MRFLLKWSHSKAHKNNGQSVKTFKTNRSARYILIEVKGKQRAVRHSIATSSRKEIQRIVNSCKKECYFVAVQRLRRGCGVVGACKVIALDWEYDIPACEAVYFCTVHKTPNFRTNIPHAKYRNIYTKLHGVTFQRHCVLLFTTATTLNFTVL